MIGGDVMSKYDKLWKYIQESGQPQLTLTFEEIGEIAGTPLNHSFLNCKKELLEYGYEVGKISMKARTVLFHTAICFGAKANSLYVTPLRDKSLRNED